MTIPETARWLKARDNFLVLTHLRPDGDTLGSAAALVRGLRLIGKTAHILRNPEATPRYTAYVEKYWAPEDFVPSFVVSVDTASEGVFPINGRQYLDKVSLCVDHHPSNTGYAENCCLDTEKASCGEIVYELLLELNGGVDAETAAALYIAVSTDTGCFAFANTTANTHRAAAALIDAGAPVGELNRELFRKKAKSRLLLEAMITSGMEFYFDGAVAIATVTLDMMEKAGASENEMDDVAAIPGSIEEVVVGITIREMSGPTDCKVSVRTTPLVDANALSARFGGGGHAMAAGFTLGATAEETKRRLLEALRESFPAKA
jgi:phosphoesterase RecJ-like protein